MKMEAIEIEHSLFPEIVVDKCYIGGRLVFDPLPHLLTQMRRVTDVSISEVMGPGRKQRVADLRYVIMWVLRTQCHWSFPRIGREFNRDHSTVQHGVKLIEARRHWRKDIAELVELMIDAIGRPHDPMLPMDMPFTEAVIRQGMAS